MVQRFQEVINALEADEQVSVVVAALKHELTPAATGKVKRAGSLRPSCFLFANAKGSLGCHSLGCHVDEGAGIGVFQQPQ
jgi:hypothetical protein